jgi:hypothetical protein
MAGGTGKIVDAILASEEFRSSLTKAVEASATLQQPHSSTQHNAIEAEVSTIFRTSRQTARIMSLPEQQTPHGPHVSTTTSQSSMLTMPVQPITPLKFQKGY